MASSRQADGIGLCVVTGTQRRHQKNYLDTFYQVAQGHIGDIVGANVYWNGRVPWWRDRQSGWTDMEYMLRDWVNWTWLSGDHIVEQHLHSLDTANWALGGHPISARAMGGRQVHQGDLYGNVYDHFAVEYEYADGKRMFSQCRQMDDTESLVTTLVDGSGGRADGRGRIFGPDGKGVWRYRNRDAPNPYEVEHAALIRSIQEGNPLNETGPVAEATGKL